jgi:hypothetical protein
VVLHKFNVSEHRENNEIYAENMVGRKGSNTLVYVIRFKITPINLLPATSILSGSVELDKSEFKRSRNIEICTMMRI